MRRRKRAAVSVLSLMLAFQLMACSNETKETKSSEQEEQSTYAYNHELNMIDDKYRNYYEIFLYSYCDSDGDGIGDINGLISKLDYINDGDDSTDTDLGFTGIWLMPIMPSPSYHKYDVSDYYSVDEAYGTVDDFKRLVEECHNRGINLIIDLPVNHTSTTISWFSEAYAYYEGLGKDEEPDTKECKYADYYNFKKDNEVSGYAKVGDSDWYYECNFDVAMPDLNLDSTQVREEIKSIIDYWMGLGVDGFRLDGVKEYYSGSTDLNVEMTGFISDYVHSINEDAYLVGEAWEDISVYAQYYKSSIDSMFDFECSQADGEIAGAIFTADGQAFTKSMLYVQKTVKQYDEDAISAEFFTNHDTTRAASIFRYNDAKIKMAAGMNLLMSGTSFTYYGEEIGMTGSGSDPNKRAPMYWNDTGDGMTSGPEQMETQENHFGSVESQQSDENSIYNYYKRAIRIRNENPEIARGTITAMETITDEEIAAVKKSYEGSDLYILYNLSETTKQVEVNKTEYDYTEIRGYLSSNGEEVILDGETVTLPPYSIVLLK